MKWHMAALASLFSGMAPGSAQSGRRLMALLADYPPSTPPHLNSTAKLSDAQCEDNLDFLVATRHTRLKALGDLLADFSLDVVPVIDPSEDPLPTFNALDRWIRSEFPVPRKPPPRQRFLESDRAGSEILFSLISDLGLLEGEAIIRRREDFAWALDLDPDNSDMPSYRRPCVVRPRMEHWASTVFDTQVTALQTAFHIGLPGAEIHPFGETATDTIAGGHDPV